MRRMLPVASGVGASAICPVCGEDVDYSTLRRSPTGVWQCPRHIDKPRPSDWPDHNHPDDLRPDIVALAHPQIGKQVVPIVEVDSDPSVPFSPPALNLSRRPTY